MQAQGPSPDTQAIPSFPMLTSTAIAPGSTGKLIPLHPARHSYSWLAPWWQATLAVFPLFIVTRIVFVLLTYFGVILFSVPNYSMHALNFQMLLNIFTLPPYTFFTAHDIIDVSALLFALALLILCFVGPVRFSVSQWSMPLFFPGYGYDPLQSTLRFVLELFVIFIVLARFARRYTWLNQWYMTLALPMLAFFTFQFLLGYWTV